MNRVYYEAILKMGGDYMSKKELRANLLLLLTAAIWGFAFVAQRVGMQYVGAFTFNAIRFAIGSVSLIPLILYFNKNIKDKVSKKETITAGILTGFVLFTGATLQQVGLIYTTAGKAGFITGLYMVFVPIFGIFLKQKAGKNAWIGVGLAVTGLYLLSINENFTIGFGDMLQLIGSVFWAIHILTIDHFTKRVDPLKLSSIQFATCSLLSMIVALIFEKITMVGISNAIIPILYGGIFSVGVAYTLQVVAQKDAKPSHAAIILSMESVFGALGGALLLKESMNIRGYIGCALILSGIIISQMKGNKKEALIQ